LLQHFWLSAFLSLFLLSVKRERKRRKKGKLHVVPKERVCLLCEIANRVLCNTNFLNLVTDRRKKETQREGGTLFWSKNKKERPRALSLLLRHPKSEPEQ